MAYHDNEAMPHLLLVCPQPLFYPVFGSMGAANGVSRTVFQLFIVLSICSVKIVIGLKIVVSNIGHMPHWGEI